MEREIGETFEYEGKILKVYKAYYLSCDGCVLQGTGKCIEPMCIFGVCVGNCRDDKTNVIFKEVK